MKGRLVFEKAGPVEIVYNVEENPGAAVRGRCHAAQAPLKVRLRVFCV